jgi:predicted anti-sigma-YlaC factor YlaD
MKCANVRKHLSEYIDGKLEGKLKEQVEEHLLSCKACSEDLDTIMAIKKQLGNMEEIEVPKDFISKIHKRIEDGSDFKKIFNSLFKPARVKVPLELAAGLTAVVV